MASASLPGRVQPALSHVAIPAQTYAKAPEIVLGAAANEEDFKYSFDNFGAVTPHNPKNILETCFEFNCLQDNSISTK